MKILITGGNGQLAKSYLEVDRSNEIIVLGKKELDITNSKQISAKIKEINPNIILHFASLTRRIECAQNKKLAFEINVQGTKNIVNECIKHDIELLFISSNEVFSGEKLEPYCENDVPNPVTTVGKTKLEAEKYISQKMTKFYIVRTSWLYSKWTNNFLQTIINLAKEKKSISVVTDETGSPTNSLDLAKVIKKLISSHQYGLYHVSNKGNVSRYEFAKFIFKQLDIDVDLKPIQSNDFSSIEAAPLHSALASKKLSTLGLKVRDWEEALSDFLNK